MLLIEKVQRLDLGIQGEHKSRTIQINCAAWQQNHPNGAISIYHRRSAETEPGVTGASYDAETGILAWSPTEYDTFYAGWGEAQIRLTEDEVIKKTIILQTIVRPSIANEQTSQIESNWEGYIKEVERLKNETVETLQTALEAREIEEEILEAAQAAQENAEAWAVGTRGGEAVEPEDETYENSGKYHAQQTAASEQNAKSYMERAEAAYHDAIMKYHLGFYLDEDGDLCQDENPAEEEEE